MLQNNIFITYRVSEMFYNNIILYVSKYYMFYSFTVIEFVMHFANRFIIRCVFTGS